VSGAREIVQRFSWLLAFPPDPPPAPAWRRRRCSDRSLVLREHPTSRQRRCRAYGLWPSPTRPPSTAQRALTRSPSSCAKSFSACSGSMTAWSPPGTRENAPCGVAFRTARRRRRSKWLITRLNGWPAVSPVNASATPSRAPPHDSGAGWFAIPFLYRTFIDYSLPVSWRTVLSPLPRHSHWRQCFAHPSSDISLPRKGRRVGLCIVNFEAFSAFTRVTARTLALPPMRGTLYPKASDISSPPCLLRLLPAGAVAGRVSHPLESAAFARRTPIRDVCSSELVALKRSFGSGPMPLWSLQRRARTGRRHAGQLGAALGCGATD